MNFPSPEWMAVAHLTPPSRWATLADRIALVEHAIASLGEQLDQTLDRVQELPGVAEDDQLFWGCETLRLNAERAATYLESLDALLGELFGEFGPKVKNSLGQRFVRWREGPWAELVPMTTHD